MNRIHQIVMRSVHILIVIYLFFWNYRQPIDVIQSNDVAKYWNPSNIKIR